MKNKILIANWNTIEEHKGGQESFFSELGKVLDAKQVSFEQAKKSLMAPDVETGFHIVYKGHIIEKYLGKYETLFKPDLIIKNSGIGGFENIKTPQIVVFQDPFYSIQKFMVDKKIFDSKMEFYSACVDLQRRTGNQAHKNVAVSDFMKQEMGLFGIKCDKVIKHGIDIELFKPLKNKEKLRKKYGIPKDKKVGIMVTKFTPAKGWEMVVGLVNHFQDIFWIIVRTATKADYQDKPVLKNVVLIDKVPREQMPELYNCADFLVNPSPVESFSLCGLEAMACDIPVISYKTGFVWKWGHISDAGIFINEWDFNEYKEAVKEFMQGKYKFCPREVIIQEELTKKRFDKEWKEFVEQCIKETKLK